MAQNTKNRMAKLEIRVEASDELLLEMVQKELENLWPFAFSSEITQNKREPRVGWFRCYLNLSLPIPEGGNDQ